MRRASIAPGLAALGRLLVAGLAAPAAAADPGLLVTVGEVTDTTAVVWVRGVTWGEVTVRYEPLGRAPGPGAEGLAGARGEIRVEPSRHLTGKLLLQPLEPGTRYATPGPERGRGRGE